MYCNTGKIQGGTTTRSLREIVIVLKMEDGPNKTLKYFVIVVNGIFVLFGIVLIAVGAWIETHVGPYVTVSMINYVAGNRVLIFVGCVIAIASLIGIVGTLAENRVLMIIFFVILLVLLTLEVAGIVVAYENRDKVKKSIDNEFKENMKTFPGKGGKAIDDMQQKLRCCGANDGPKDWLLNDHFKVTASVPDACCMSQHMAKGCGNGQILKHDKIYEEPCMPKLQELISDKIKVIAALGVSLLVIQLIGMAFSLVLIFRVKESTRFA